MLSQEIFVFCIVIIITLFNGSRQDQKKDELFRRRWVIYRKGMQQWRAIKGLPPACTPCFFYGKYIAIHESPYVAALEGCGAAILSDRWLVTTAQCLDRRLEPGNKVWVGGENNSNSQVITYKRMIIHPQYKMIKNIPINDIALLELNQKLTLSDKIKPIKIATRDVTNAKDLLFVGKGNELASRRSESIKKLELKTLTARQCLEEMPSTIQRKVKPYLKHLEKMNICTRTEDNPGLCMGDSGSPVTYNNQLVGLASYIGDTECYKTRINILTKMSTYANWIKSITGIK